MKMQYELILNMYIPLPNKTHRADNENIKEKHGNN
jgi:hypothetical protein